MTPQELFQALTPRKRTNYAGSYFVFKLALRKELPEQLQPGYVKFALEWVARGNAKGHDFEELGERIMIMGWEALEQHPELAQPFARAALARLRDHEAIAKGSEDRPFGQVVRQDAVRRRAVLAAMMESVVPQGETFWLVHAQTPLATDEDVVWLAERVLEAPPDRKDAWLSLINWVFNPHKPGHLDTVIGLCKREPSLAKAFSWLNAVEIESPQGRKMKAEFLRTQRRRDRFERMRRQRDAQLPRPEHIPALVQQIEDGDPVAWSLLSQAMAWGPDTTEPDYEPAPDMTELPGWRNADDQTRAQVLEAAERLLASPPAIDLSWVGTSTHPVWVLALYSSITLVFLHDPAFLGRLLESAWRTWVPILLSYSLERDDGEERHKHLVRIAYEHAPDAVLDFLRVASHEAVRVEHCWDDRIAQVLLEKATSHDVQPNRLEALLCQLLKHEYPPALEHALSQVSVALPTDASHRPNSGRGPRAQRPVS